MAFLLCATAPTAVARLSHSNSVCPSVRLSVTRADQLKTVQARNKIFTIACLEDSSFRNRKASISLKGVTLKRALNERGYGKFAIFCRYGVGRVRQVVPSGEYT